MQAVLQKNEFDAIVVGSGIGGATVARELSNQKKNKISMGMKQYWDLLHEHGEDSRELFHKINSDGAKGAEIRS